jgi:hypothetical protein
MMMLSKKIEEMSELEKIQLELCKAIALSKGVDADSPKFNCDFKETGTFWKASKFIIDRFDVKLKSKPIQNVIVNKEEVKENLSENNEIEKESILSSDSIQKVEQWSPDGKLIIGVFNSSEEAFDKTGISGIKLVCEHEKVSAGTFYWKYENEDWNEWNKKREEFKNKGKS